jgi:hypothetical protein
MNADQRRGGEALRILRALDALKQQAFQEAFKSALDPS